jgi:serine/threonine-protein kinase/endoribonuclease IRE1
MAGVGSLQRIGVRHGNLNPNNVLILKKQPWDDHVQVNLSNFSCYSSLNHNRIRDTGKGTRGWQSPEQLKGIHRELKSDIYVLGLIIYYIIVGRHVFGHIDSFRVISNIGYVEDCVRKGQLNITTTTLMPEAINLVSKLLDNDPTKRPCPLTLRSHPFF